MILNINSKGGRMLEKEENSARASRVLIKSWFRRPRVHSRYRIVQGRQDAPANNVLFVSRHAEGLRHSTEKWVEKKIVGNWDQRGKCGGW